MSCIQIYACRLVSRKKNQKKIGKWIRFFRPFRLKTEKNRQIFVLVILAVVL